MCLSRNDMHALSLFSCCRPCASRQAELEGMRSGRLRSSGSAVRLGSLKQGSTLERRRGALAFVEPPRRSGRHADKRVR